MSEEEVRIGVYVCHCGGNISDYVDVKKVVEAIKDEPGVVVAKDVVFACSDASQNEIIEDIKKHKLNRIVVASCSPKLHEATFRGTVTRAGLNPYLYYHANIREHVSWAHTDDPKGATEKAIRHVRAAIAYVRHAKPLEKIKSPSIPAVLIIGGGVSGIKAAIDLAKMGIAVHLVERSPFLGGRVSQLYKIYPYDKSGVEIVKELVDELKKYDNIAVYTNAEVESVDGYIGNFNVTIKVYPRYVVKKSDKFKEAIEKCPVEVPNEFDFGLTKRKAIYIPYDGAYPELPAIDDKACTKCGECIKICGDAIDLNQKPETIKVKVGAIIVATGADPYEPKKGEFGYGEYDNVITLQQLHRLLATYKGDEEFRFNGRKIENIAFIYCVGSRQIPTGEGPVNEYCSRYCCNAAMYISLKLLERFKNLNIYHLYRDIRTYGKNEPLYEAAGKNGIIFIKYDEAEPPKISKRGDKLIITTKDLLTENLTLEIPVDLVVLVTGLVPRENKKLIEVLKLPLGRDRFYQEAHPKLRPVETNIGGLFICGCAQAPRDTREAVASAEAAAAKAAAIALKKEIELEPFVAEVDPSKCNLSKKCMEVCEYEAIEIKNYEGIGERAWVNEAKCKGCGACVAVCPTEAIQLRGLWNEQLKDMIRASAKEVVL